MRTVYAIGAAFFVGLLACNAAAAQDDSPADARGAAYRRVAKLCATDAARFCPVMDQASTFSRDQVLCLKMYRVDLSLPCRNAVAAVLAATQAPP